MTDKPDVLEAVTQAIYDTQGDFVSIEDVARAALTAVLDHMRQPSEEMEAVVAANWGRRTWAEYHIVLNQYRMEALND